MTENDDIKRFSDQEAAGGVVHLFSIWLLCSPPIFLMVLGLIEGLFKSVAPNVLNSMGRRLGLTMLLISAVHWVFTGAAVADGIALVVRRVSISKKISALIALSLSIAASFYIRSAYQF